MYLPKMFDVWRWYTTLYIAAVFYLWQLSALARAAEEAPLVVLRAEDIDAFVNAVTNELNRGTGLGAVLTNPAVLTALVATLGGILTLVLTDAAKLSTTIKGSQTQILASLFAMLTAGATGYFGVSEVAGLSGWEGAIAAAVSALGAFGVATGLHERERRDATGMRKPARETAKSDAVSVTTGLAADGLKLLAKGGGIPAFVVDALISERGIERAEQAVRGMLARAPTADESHVRVVEEAKRRTPKGAQ